MRDFEQTVKKAERGVDVMIMYHDSFGYEEFGDAGNACYKPYRDDELLEVNEMIGAVRVAMPKHSDRHAVLAKAVAGDIGVTWVTYDWLCKATARILVGVQDIDDLKEKGELSRKVRQRMAEKNITALS